MTGPTGESEKDALHSAAAADILTSFRVVATEPARVLVWACKLRRRLLQSHVCELA